jgi:hypothetical protein
MTAPLSLRATRLCDFQWERIPRRPDFRSRYKISLLRRFTANAIRSTDALTITRSTAFHQ